MFLNKYGGFMEYCNYNAERLDIFLKAMGDGFSDKVICYEQDGKKICSPENFRQKILKMRKEKDTCEVARLVQEGCRRFVGLDETEKYCVCRGSDKYTKFFRGLWTEFNFYHESFSHEKEENILAYLITQWLILSCKKESCPEYETNDPSIKELFRPEYYSAMWDVVSNRKNNKTTFYKWPIDEFYGGTKENTPERIQIEKIIGCVFSEKDNIINSSFGKLKSESGKRKWNTMDTLFQNENGVPNLKSLLDKDNILEKYQIFQARMIIAFFLENLLSVLCSEEGVGEELGKDVFDSLFTHVKGESIDLKAKFGISSHDETTKIYCYQWESLCDFKSMLQN